MKYEAIDSGVIGQRLVDARKQAGITQQQATDHLGCSRPTLIAMEKGKRRPSPTELTRLAELYQRSIHEFVRSGAAAEAIQPHLRAAVRASPLDSAKLEQAIAELQHFADDYRQLEQLAGAQPFHDYPPSVSLPRSANVLRFAEHVAQRERSRLNLGDQPIIHMRKLLEDEVGLRIFYGLIPSQIAGMYAFVRDLGYCILINRKHPPTRRRWTIAHEYGHFLADRDNPGMDYIGANAKKPNNERFADAFAAGFLMPDSGIRRHFYDIVNRTGDFQVADLCRLSDLYFVSTPAMTLRLESMRLIAKGTWEFLSESRFEPGAAKRNLNLRSDQDHASNQAYPERYKYLAVQAYIQEKISEGQLARFLRCDRVEARAVVAECLSDRDLDNVGDEGEWNLPFEQSLIHDDSEQAYG